VDARQRASYYRDLIPLTQPGPDEQFAFEVDLNACSGCKACVTACHSLNGLEEEETWRSVGLLQGNVGGQHTLQYVAVFHFTSRNQWFATQNMCPHKRAFVLSRGIIGSQGDIPKVACPLHKKMFSLETGECLSGDEMSVKVFP
jgi:NAD(P)H-dependent nitrite reductase small subunit